MYVMPSSELLDREASRLLNNVVYWLRMSLFVQQLRWLFHRYSWMCDTKKWRYIGATSFLASLGGAIQTAGAGEQQWLCSFVDLKSYRKHLPGKVCTQMQGCNHGMIIVVRLSWGGTSPFQLNLRPIPQEGTYVLSCKPSQETVAQKSKTPGEN